MTKQEKEKIKKAIKYLHTHDDYYKGMDILAKLVEIPVIDLGEIKFIPLHELPEKSKFKAPNMKTIN